MIINFFKERKEQEYKRCLLAHEQRNKLRRKMLKILEDERWYDITYVIYSSEFPNLSLSEICIFLNYVCNIGGFVSRVQQFYPRGFLIYIYVRKRENPKYNVGDVVHFEESTFERASDIIILGRAYDGKGHYMYLVPTACALGINEPARLHWQYLDNTEKVNSANIKEV